MLLHSNTLFWFRANQSLLFLLNAACLTEKQQIQISVFGLTRPRLEPTIYRTRGEHANYYATDAVNNLAVRGCNPHLVCIMFIWDLQLKKYTSSIFEKTKY
jgi:hypothetical protein